MDPPPSGVADRLIAKLTALPVELAREARDVVRSAADVHDDMEALCESFRSVVERLEAHFGTGTDEYRDLWAGLLGYGTTADLLLSIAAMATVATQCGADDPMPSVVAHHRTRRSLTALDAVVAKAAPDGRPVPTYAPLADALRQTVDDLARLMAEVRAAWAETAPACREGAVADQISDDETAIKATGLDDVLDLVEQARRTLVVDPGEVDA